MLSTERQRQRGARRTPPSQRTVFFAAAALLVAGEALFWLMVASIQTNSGLAVFDGGIHDALVDHRSPPATAVLSAVSTVTAPATLSVIAGILALGWALLRRELWRPGLFLAAVLAAAAVTTVVKQMVSRARPSSAGFLLGPDDALSFPSGHTLGAGVFLLVLGYLLLGSAAARPARRSTAVLALAGAALGTLVVAVSRLYLGYHWLTDVVASLGLAVALAGVVVLVDGLRSARRASSQPDPGIAPAGQAAGAAPTAGAAREPEAWKPAPEA